jgi:nucleotide-binding universal stress UspA family protein
VEIAADEARLRGLELLIVHAISGAASLQRAEAIVQGAAEGARARAPDLHVSTLIDTGASLAVLAAASRHAHLVVVGRRSGALARVRSTAAIGSIIGHSPCPVIVAQGVRSSPANVLVGVGTSRATPAALAFAFEESDLRNTGLTAIHAWRSPVLATHGAARGLAVMGEAGSNLEAARILSESLAGWSEQFPDIQVRRALPEGSTIDALVAASVNAQMLVIGSRRMTALRSSAIVHEVIRRAACPVAVVQI